MSNVNYFRTSNAILRKLASEGDSNATAELDRRKARRAEKAAKGTLGYVQAALAGEPKARRTKAKAKAKAADTDIAKAAKLLGIDADKLAALATVLKG